MADFVSPAEGDLPPEVAKSVLDWKFNDRAVARMTELADRNCQGQLTALEREELDKYLRVGSFVNLLQGKGRLP